MGFHPGPEFKLVLNSLEDAQLDGRIKSKDEAIRFARIEFDRLQAAHGSDLSGGKGQN
jgi:hypothetical protein